MSHRLPQLPWDLVASVVALVEREREREGGKKMLNN